MTFKFHNYEWYHVGSDEMTRLGGGHENNENTYVLFFLQMPKSRTSSAAANKKSKPALSPKTSESKTVKKVAKAGVLQKVLKDGDQKVIDAREVINTQIAHMVIRLIGK